VDSIHYYYGSLSMLRSDTEREAHTHDAAGAQYDVSQCRAGTPAGRSCVVRCRPGYTARPNPAAGGYPRTNVPAGTYTCADVRLVGTWRGVPPVCVGVSSFKSDWPLPEPTASFASHDHPNMPYPVRKYPG
jgi:hypothetical protein